ncbi:uncharacterized protein V6R79_011610 [Siganus canaliculatus]
MAPLNAALTILFKPTKKKTVTHSQSSLHSAAENNDWTHHRGSSRFWELNVSTLKTTREARSLESEPFSLKDKIQGEKRLVSSLLFK